MDTKNKSEKDSRVNELETGLDNVDLVFEIDQKTIQNFAEAAASATRLASESLAKYQQYNNYVAAKRIQRAGEIIKIGSVVASGIVGIGKVMTGLLGKK